MEKELAPNTPESEIRQGSDDKKAKGKKAKKDTEIEKGKEGVTKANKAKGKSLDKEEEVKDGCGCPEKKGKKDMAFTASAIKRSDACWKGYVQQGMKMKGGKRVANCVPAGAKKKKDGAYGKKADGGSCGKKGKSVWADGYEFDAATLAMGSSNLATDTNKNATRKPNAFSSTRNKIIAGTLNT